VAYTEALLDALAKRLMERDAGLRNTLLVVVSDHGEAFGEHGSWEHGTSLFSEATRVPLLLAGGPVQRALASGALVADDSAAISGVHRLEDLSPTILELLGLDGASSLRSVLDQKHAQLRGALARVGLGGRSLLWASRQAQAGPQRVLLMHSMFGQRTVGLVHSICGTWYKSIYKYSGCGNCEVREAQHKLLQPQDRGRGNASVLVAEIPIRPPSGAEPLPLAMKLLASLDALHRQVRDDGVTAANSRPVDGMLQTSTAAERLARANALLQELLPSADKDASTFRLSFNESSSTCTCRRVGGRALLQSNLTQALRCDEGLRPIHALAQGLTQA